MGAAAFLSLGVSLVEASIRLPTPVAFPVSFVLEAAIPILMLRLVVIDLIPIPNSIDALTLPLYM